MNNISELFPEENNKEYFLENLPGMLASSQRNWNRVSQDAWSESSFNRLYELITDITSKSAFHDLSALHDAARSIQDYLLPFIDKNAIPSSTQITQINEFFEKLEATQQQVIEEYQQSLGPSKKLIYAIGSKNEICSSICEKLDISLYDTKLFSDTDTGISQIKQTRPDLVILETDNIDELTTIHSTLLDSHDQHVAVLLISHHDDTSTRLTAMRSGVSRYFSPPHDAVQISREIENLCKTEKARPYKVLIIEDDPTQAEFASSILTKAGMVTNVVTHPLQVMDAMRAFAPDIILMDIYMPDADGLELTTIIRDDLQYLATPIIFLSGETDQDKKINALLLGGDDFISKPIRPKHLIATIKNRIRRTRDLIHAIKLQVTNQTANITQLSPDDSNKIIESDYLSETSAEAENEPATTTIVSEADLLCDKIRVALQTNSFKNFYQPILCVNGKSDNSYSLLLTLADGDRIVQWDSMVTATQGSDLHSQLNQRAVQSALDSINELKNEGKQGLIFLPQTINDLENESDADWIRDALRSHRTTGTSLILEYNLSELAPHIKKAKQYFSILKEMGISICLSEFPAKKAAFKLLQYLKVDYIKTARKLLETESDVINTYVNQAHRLKCKVIVANISDPRYVNLHWTTLADFLQGDFISPASDDMNFNFSQAAL
jgi:PleD family two-component response regulator/EAL domain-containing protein (putative c-di-GMP-specific phosphodiesterase class I)